MVRYYLQQLSNFLVKNFSMMVDLHTTLRNIFLKNQKNRFIWFFSTDLNHDLNQGKKIMIYDFFDFFNIFISFETCLRFILADIVINIIYRPNIIWMCVLYVLHVYDMNYIGIIYIYIGRPGSLYIRFMMSWSGLKKITIYFKQREKFSNAALSGKFKAGPIITNIFYIGLHVPWVCNCISLL